MSDWGPPPIAGLAAHYERVLNVQLDYGAVGDGSADDTIPLQNAFAAAQAATHGAIIDLPLGTYGVKAEIPVTGGKIWLRGQGMGNLAVGATQTGSVIKPLAGFVGTYPLNVYSGDDATAVKGFIGSDFAVEGSALATINSATLNGSSANIGMILDPVTSLVGINFQAQHSYLIRVLTQRFTAGGVRMYEPDGVGSAGNLHNDYLLFCKTLICGQYGVLYGNGTSDCQQMGGLVYTIGSLFTFGVSAATDVFTTSVAHGFVNGDTVFLPNLGGATGVAMATVYYVRDVTPLTFKLALSAGGAAIDVTGNGSNGRVGKIGGQTGNAIQNDGSGNSFGDSLNLNATLGPALYSTSNGRQADLDQVRMRNCGGGAYFVKTGMNVGGCKFRDASNWVDGMMDAIHVEPVTDAHGSGGGVIDGCDFTCTADTTRPRYLINVANARAQRVSVGAYSYGWDDPATTAWATDDINDAGTDTKIAQPRGVASYSAAGGGSVAVDARRGSHAIVTATGATITVSVSGLKKGWQQTLELVNLSGGASAATFSGITLAGAWVDPANGKRRILVVAYDGTNIYEVSRSAADL